VREEDHDRFLRVRRCVHAQVRDVVRRLVGGLEALESDVLASLQLDQVLDAASSIRSERSTRVRAVNSPVDDDHRAVFLPLTNITSSEPPVSREDGRVRVQIVPLVVALRDRGTANPDLALRRIGVCLVASFGDVHELDLDRGRRKTDVTELQEFGWEDRAHA
jgi:hypothetical protein